MGANIPRVPTDNRELNQYQHNVQNALQPVFNNPINYGTQKASINLAIGDNPVNFGLGRQLNGWFIVRQRGVASIYDKYDTQNTNEYPLNQTIILNSSAAVSVDIWFY